MAILAPLDVQHLKEQALLTSAPVLKYLRVHKRRLQRLSDEEHFDTPVDIKPDSPAAAVAYATIPEDLRSKETLHYVGFTDEMADRIWKGWANWPPGSPVREIDAEDGMSFLEYFLGPEYHSTLIERTSKRPAVQYAFSGYEEGSEFLEENGARDIMVIP